MSLDDLFFLMSAAILVIYMVGKWNRARTIVERRPGTELHFPPSTIALRAGALRGWTVVTHCTECKAMGHECDYMPGHPCRNCGSWGSLPRRAGKWHVPQYTNRKDGQPVLTAGWWETRESI